MEGTLKVIHTQVIIQASDIRTMEDILIIILRDKPRKFTGASPREYMHPDKERNTTVTIAMIAGMTESMGIRKAKSTTTIAGIMTKTGNIKLVLRTR